MKKTSLLFILGLIILTSSILISCKKEKPTVVVVEVRDVEDLVVANADVRLYALPTPIDPNSPEGQIEHGELRIDTLIATNGAGKAIFDFTDYYELGQSGLFVLNVEVTKGLLFGEGIIKVTPEEETVKTIVIE